MRLPFLVVALVLLVCPSPALAEDEPMPGAEAQVPPFGLDDIAVPADALPEGWKAGTAPAGAPTAAVLAKLATDAGIDAGKVLAKAQALTKGEGESAVTGVVAWLALDDVSAGFGEAFKAAVDQGGWRIKPIGSPLRMALAWADSEAAAKELQAWQLEATLQRLCSRALETLKSTRQQFDPHAQAATARRGQAMLAAVLQTEPEAAFAHAVVAQMVQQQHPETAVEHNRKALDEDAPVQPPPDWIIMAAFNVGGALLTKGDPELVGEAAAILSRAVALEEHAPDAFQRFGNRYNLACAYARLGKLDAAFEHLEVSFAALKSAWEEDKQKSFSGMSQLEYPRHYEHAKLIDSDMDALRKDPRWAPLMAKMDPYAPAPKPVAPKPDTPKKDDGDK